MSNPVVTMTNPNNGSTATIVPDGHINVMAFVEDEKSKGFVLDSEILGKKVESLRDSLKKAKPEEAKTIEGEIEKNIELLEERKADEAALLS
jgi:hypothetical protein